jgi:hypothetical protein
MFKTDDKIIQICLSLSGLIFMLYAGMMAFNTGYFLDRYPTFDSDTTNSYFIVWFGLNNIMFLSGIYYMGYKGLDHGFFIFLIPATVLNIVWIIMSHMATGGDNYTGLFLVSLNLAFILVARVRAGYSITWTKADTAWGTTDGPSKMALYGMLVLQLFIMIGYFVQPNGLMESNPNLEVTQAGSHFALGLFFLNIAIVIALIYQMRVGYSGTLITMGMVWYTIFFSLVIMNISDAQGDMSQGDPMLASVITIGFILNSVAFFRLQKSF